MDLVNMHAFSQMAAQGRPEAQAVLRGNNANTHIGGTVRFYPADKGTLVVAEVFGLPRFVYPKGSEESAGPFYGFHIHEGRECGSGAGDDPFKETGGHYNPTGAAHPEHAGDMPALLADQGYAYMMFYTGRFTPKQVIGRTVVIHQHPDDFNTQPSGASGQKIACGQILGVPEPR